LPTWLTRVRLRIRALLVGRQFERDLDDEIRFHLTMREAAFRADGRPAPERAARRRFGNPIRTHEELRELWTLWPGLRGLGCDASYAFRTLERAPGFTAIAVLTLALGTAVSTVGFAVASAVLLRPLGYQAEDRLVVVHENFPDAGVERWPLSALDFEDLVRWQRSFDRVGAYRTIPVELGGNARPERRPAARVSADLFETLGAVPYLGRTLRGDDVRSGAGVVVLSWGLWKRRYEGTPDILGRVIAIDRQPHVVVGVMPRTFVFPHRGPQSNSEPADLWVPLTFRTSERAERGAHLANSVIARLESGIGLSQARAQLAAISQQIAGEYPPVVRAAGFTPRLSLLPLRDEIRGRFRLPLLLLVFAVALVWLVACSNVANLVLNRAASRRQELAVRLALGARRTRLFQLLLAEAALLVAAGTGAGVAMALAGLSAVPAVLTSSLPGLQSLALDGRVVGATAILSLGATVTFACLPFGVFRRDPGDVLRAGAGRVVGPALRIRKAAVVSAVAMAVVLLVGAGLLVRSFLALIAIDPGVRPQGVMTIALSLPEAAYPTPARVSAFQDRLLAALASLPEVRHAAMASEFPLETADTRRFEPADSAAPTGVTPVTRRSSVRGSYFETFGVSLRQGRLFNADDHTAPREVVIVNQALADRFWPGQPAVGQRLKWGAAGGAYPWLTVIGVVANLINGPPGAPAEPHAWEPFRQLPPVFLGRNVRAAVRVVPDADEEMVAGRLRDTIASLDPQLAIERVEPLEVAFAAARAPQRAGTVTVTFSALTTLVLAAIGLGGLLACVVADRRREIAVRLALGATPRAAAALVVRDGARLVAAGLAAGLGLSAALVPVVGSLLHSTSAYDMTTFLLVPLAVASAAVISVALPAWRAARVEPLRTLRAE
jgi:predicted permease